MKRTTITCLLLCFLFSISAQEKFKFGTCPVELLEMTTYENDPDASAVVIYENADVSYQIPPSSSANLFILITNYVVRIKILTQDGIEEANNTVSYYVGKNKADSERVEGITGWTYNLEGGKVVKEKLSKDYIFTEDISDTRKRVKFALPSVKVGSVIEYKYALTSPHYNYIDDYVFQRSIPVMYSAYSITIPEYFTFNREIKGYEPVRINVKSVNLSFHYEGRVIQTTGEEITAEVQNLPAIKDESYVWNYNDYKSRINFEIKSMRFVGDRLRNFTTNWSDVVKQLNNSSRFGGQFNNKGLFRDELPEILSGKSNDVDSIRSILNLVRSHVKWNDQTALFVNNLSKSLKDGTGNSADINAILLNTLRNAGFTAYPIAMSLRSKGRVPITYPSINNLNYFIVSVKSGDKTYYLDATKSYTDVNVIPIDCMVDKALLINEEGFDWIDLSQIEGSYNRVNMSYSFNEEGILSGKKTESYLGEVGYSFKQSYYRASSEEDFVEKLEAKDEMKVSNYKLEERTAPSFGYAESYDFTMDHIALGDDIISFNPLLFFAMKTNSFQPETRALPIEFPYPYEQRINVNFTIPEGYELDEIPAPERFTFEEDWVDFSYNIQQVQNHVQISYRLKISTSIISANYYQELRDFWAKMYSKENEMLTIKKL